MIYYSKNHWYVFFSTYYKIVTKIWPIIVATIIPTVAYGIALTWILLIVLAIFAFLRWQNEFIIINEEYLIYKRGIIEREEFNIPLSSISLVEFNRNIGHKILGLNRMKIESISPKDRSFHIIMVFKLSKVEEIKKAFHVRKCFDYNENYNLEGSLSYKISKIDLPLLLTLKSNMLLGIGTLYTIFKLLQETKFRILEDTNRLATEYMNHVLIDGVQIWNKPIYG